VCVFYRLMGMLENVSKLYFLLAGIFIHRYCFGQEKPSRILK